MNVVIGSDENGKNLKLCIKQYLLNNNYKVVDTTEDKDVDLVDATLNVAKEVQKNEKNLGIVIDAYGAGSFMVATKIKGMIAAEVSEERSAYMTRGHNNSRMITLGSEIVGEQLAINIVKAFINGKYDGGRHQIRVDMLNKMC
ncbi:MULTISPECIES: galactose-6-phosphate isomerase subunit LacA [Mammaliicoccus]|uniref:galactose-6-phosphate isomerase subunit LacA n=1 Tax=Mammaliicoccus TaxID=2803850 RepID=UPI000991E776|nr:MULTISPECIES: galactose-6-phosphate isomerase subunit LacA [Mammaliicoccus]MBO3061414.1 galactose-6-phosphate isomerase subunit LacA [Mammaliicoccus fleurettii]MDT3995744.1 galactose-6-phosphate isomerase subunit LacA [Mammaliicoccus fleurettii]MEB7724224.1 galactose-6-phosphate isomerase subunit LacA [Mammaliicoccus fleurettii]MEB8068581.1 galactose-6-phosphate isomerase subunit LacA [Mammaliicoccus fleurettii]OOV77036.1 galactose-6-phosphate isomerase subunit LacA [Mammaliicoccus fleurett